MKRRVLRANYAGWVARGSPSFAGNLRSNFGILVKGVLSPAESGSFAKIVRKARSEWTPDFGGEQFTLGSAFYTHLETGRSRDYFEAASASDRRVERFLPGLQARMRSLLGAFLGGSVRPRYGFCGAGVHVFPRDAAVAKRGGVVHFDVEGLAPAHLSAELATATLVLMLQPATFGGGLRVYDAMYHGREEPTPRQCASAYETVRYEAGDAFLMASTRLHQIRPFRGPRDRISATLHAVQVDAKERVWESWF